MTKSFPIVLTAVLTLALAAGCGVKAPLEGRNDPFEPSQIHFAQSSLKKRTAVRAPSVSRDENGQILFVTVPIRSTTNQQLYVDYRVTWFDRNGQRLSETGWATKTLAPNTPDEITVNSTTPRAADFQVDFRWAQ